MEPRPPGHYADLPDRLPLPIRIPSPKIPFSLEFLPSEHWRRDIQDDIDENGSLKPNRRLYVPPGGHPIVLALHEQYLHPQPPAMVMLACFGLVYFSSNTY